MQPGTGVLQSVVRGALAPYISSFHYIGGSPPAAGGLECILPGARVHLMVNLYEDEFRTYQGLDVHRTHGAVLGGPHATSTVIDTREQCGLLTVDFKLAGAARFFAAPLSEAQDHLVELDQLWGRDGAVLREQLLEAPSAEAKFQVLESVLLRHLVDAHDLDSAIPLAAQALGRGVPVSEVIERVGLLPKTFARRFGSQVGLTPKRYARVRRLQRLVSSIRCPAEADWSALAVEHGYAAR
jgi:hypothetical protein